MNRPSLIIISLAGLMMGCAGIGIMFPQIAEIGSEAGVAGVPFIALVLAGSLLGALLAFVSKRMSLRGYLINLGVGFLVWGAIGVIAGLATGTGSYFHRIVEGRIIGLWFSALYLLVGIMPGLLGTYAALTGSKASMSTTVALTMSLTVISMVYSEARYNRTLDQDLLPSLMTVAGLVLFVEGLSMARREEEFKGGHMGPSVFRRNLSFLFAFLAISALVSSIPFVIDLGSSDIYEFGTIYGKAIVGLLLLLPLAILALARRRT